MGCLKRFRVVRQREAREWPTSSWRSVGWCHRRTILGLVLLVAFVVFARANRPTQVHADPGAVLMRALFWWEWFGGRWPNGPRGVPVVAVSNA